MIQKVEKYFRLLHPDDEQLTLEEEWYAAGDKGFIIENIDEIDKKFQKVISESEMRGEEINEQRIMKIIFDGVRADKYTELLHPNRAELSGEETYYAACDRSFMGDHIDEIDRKFQKVILEREMRGEEINEQRIMKIIFDGVRADKYTELLHPNRAELSGEETYYAACDRSFMGDHIDEIDRKFQKVILEREMRGEEINEQRIMKIIFDGVRADKYTELLHPNRAELSGEETYYAACDRSFMGDHIDEIDRKFQKVILESEMRGEEINEQRIMKIIFDGVRADKYTELLHPNRAELSGEETYYAACDRSFMGDHIDEIDRKFQKVILEREMRGEEINEQRIMKIIFDGVRADKYTELLHPNRAELSGEETYYAACDRSFMGDHIDEIDRKFQKVISESEMRGEEINEHEIIKNIVENLKTKELTTQDIGKAIINVPTTAKVEAEQVENDENTKDNVKEGEEVGDDN